MRKEAKCCRQAEEMTGVSGRVKILIICTVIRAANFRGLFHKIIEIIVGC